MARPRLTKSGVPIDPKTGKARTGRPPAVTKEVVSKLEDAWSRDFSDIEACLHAGISKSTLKNYQNNNPEFVARKELLKAKPVMAARVTVIDGMVGRPAVIDPATGATLKAEVPPNPDLALKYLERKLKGEFSTRSEHVLGDKDEFEDLTDDQLDEQIATLQGKNAEHARRKGKAGKGSARKAKP